MDEQFPQGKPEEPVSPETEQPVSLEKEQPAPQTPDQPQAHSPFSSPIPSTPQPLPNVPPLPNQPPIPNQPPVVPPMQKLPMTALPPISKAEAESCRHRKEKPWYRILAVLNVLLIIGVILTVCFSFSEYMADLEELGTMTMSSGDSISQSDMEDAVNELPIALRLFCSGVVSLAILLPYLYFMYAQVRASSVKITPRNFPEIYALIESFAKRLGMEKVPEAYVVQQSGVLNAFSAFLFRRQYIQINAEIFEVGYRENHDIESLAFVIAHEISHIYYGHATLHYNMWILFTNSFPILGQIASRTREYSCDRLAQHLTQNDGLDAMIMLMVDRHLYKMVDKVDYLENAAKERGFMLWLVNLLSSHPIMPKRIRALAMRQGSGELY